MNTTTRQSKDKQGLGGSQDNARSSSQDMQSIIATFEDNRTAQQAVEQLVERGFDRSTIHVQSAYEKETTSSRAAGSSLLDPFGFAGVFSALFGAGSTEEAGKYAEAVRRGNTVVVFEAEDADVEEATQLMQELGAVDMDQRAAQWQSKGWTGFDVDAKPLSEEELASEREGTVMPVVQEELQVGKREVQGGGVRVVKRVTEVPASETITLREEHATLERRPVDRAATEGDLANFEEGTVEVRETSEEAVVGKTARVVEEVMVGKEVTERTETVSDTVRRTDVDVERVDSKSAAAATRNPPARKKK
jgi:uncharacterized protein (TIGR02271 family)